MNGISQNGEAWWGQNDPQPCLQGDLNPDQCILTKKSNGKDQIQTSALPTELYSQVTEWCNISLELLMWAAN